MSYSASSSLALPLRREGSVRPGGWRHRVVRGLRGSRAGVIGALLVGLLLLVAAAGPLIAPYDPLAQDYDALLSPPTVAHPLGTDNLGRDNLSRLLYGAQVSLQVGILTVLLAALIGVSAGLIAAQLRGTVDQVIMRIVDGIMAFPSLLLALALLTVLGPNLRNIIIAIAIGNLPKFARLARAQALAIGASDYILAARVVGAGHARTIAHHVWPNATDPIIVQASLTIGSAIILEAGLSFLGLGVQPPTPTWGWMLKSGYPFIQTAPWVPIVPGLAIFFTVLGFNLLGDALRDALDPRISD
jgi:peptide/nickel transport system permease protein